MRGSRIRSVVQPFAVIDRDRNGDEAVLMVVAERTDAEAIAMDLRNNGVRADVIEAP